MKKTKQCVASKKLAGDDESPEQWRVGLTNMGSNTKSPIKEISPALENFKDYEMKFQSQKKSVFRKNYSRNDDCKNPSN